MHFSSSYRHRKHRFFCSGRVSICKNIGIVVWIIQTVWYILGILTGRIILILCVLGIYGDVSSFFIHYFICVPRVTYFGYMENTYRFILKLLLMILPDFLKMLLFSRRYLWFHIYKPWICYRNTKFLYIFILICHTWNIIIIFGVVFLVCWVLMGYEVVSWV